MQLRNTDCSELKAKEAEAKLILRRSDMPKTIDEKILDKLDLILRVVALQLASEKSVTEGARALKIAGLDNRTIADILNTSEATVRTLASNLRRRP